MLTLFDTEGKKLNLFEPDEGPFETDPLCKFPVFNQEITGYIIHIDSADSIYLHRTTDEQTIKQLLDDLYEFYESGGETAQYERYCYCGAKSNDGNWYRGRMDREEGHEISVMFIDYGNTESIPKNKIKRLDNRFYKLHRLALKVRLHLDQTSPNLKDTIIELTQAKELKAHIYFGETTWWTELYEEDNHINQMLIDLNLATLKTPAILQTRPAKVETPDVRNAQKRTAVYVTHVDSPSEFYVQLSANKDDITMLQWNLQDYVHLFPSMDVAKVGEYCAAKYTVDEEWYRAEVLVADSDKTTVRFVDFGNTDVIDNNTASLKTLPSELLAVDKYAMKCNIAITPTTGHDWSEDVSELFKCVLQMNHLLADIIYEDEEENTSVNLFIDQKNIAEFLIDAGLAQSITRNVQDEPASNTGFTD